MFGQRRIAHKIWLGYTIPLAVLVVAGVLVPAVLSAILGRITREYERTREFVGQVAAMERSALAARDHLRGYVLFGHDPEDRQQFRASVAEYRRLSRDVAGQAARLPRPGPLLTVLRQANAEYEDWLHRIAQPELDRNRAELPASFVRASKVKFDRVKASFVQLTTMAEERRARQGESAAAVEQVRRVIMFVVPVAALAIALLIGRSISLGVTRPLLALTRATEALEKGQKPPSLVAADEDAPEDEIGDLTRSFRRMTRTIGQREAVLRAQNEALGAISRRVEAVLNATNDGIVMLDRAGGFSVVNQRFADLFGLDADTLLEQTFDEAGPQILSRFKDTRGVRARMRALLTEPETVADETFEIVEPEKRVLRVYSAPVRGEPTPGNENGERLGRIFVFRDVTRETAVDRMKTEFISVVSHELRTPLTAIKGYVDLIVGEQTGPINATQREFLTIVQSSTSRLTALINDMLDISRIESGRVEVKREIVDYGRVVRETVQTLQGEADAQGVTIKADIPDDLPPVTGDADRIAQVLINLLSNGIKYTPRGGRVIVSFEAAETRVTTRIADTGIGISEADQQRLFQKFFRADNSTTREAGGTGLGLAITKAIVEKLHGSIWMESRPGHGSSFFFSLPTATIDRDSGPTGAKGLVLNIHPDPALVRRINQHLSRGGFATAGAATAEDGLRRARELKPDLILLDAGILAAPDETLPLDGLGSCGGSSPNRTRRPYRWCCGRWSPARPLRRTPRTPSRCWSIRRTTHGSTRFSAALWRRRAGKGDRRRPCSSSPAGTPTSRRAWRSGPKRHRAARPRRA
jgi:PAS domain S-box-containing protein